MVVSTPLMPAYFYYKKLKNKLKEVDLLENLQHKSISKEESLLATIRESQFKINRYLGKLRSNESVFEHLVQLLVLLLVCLLRKTRTGIQTGLVARLDILYLSDNATFVYLSAGWSLLSIIRGQISYIIYRKNFPHLLERYC
jgi:hypothetical protein